MAEIKLHYFDIYGRAETARMILHYNGTAFEDNRLQFEEWPALKASGIAEFGQLPVLEIDGHKLVQSHSINRYLCQKFGYYPSDPFQIYLVESICDLKEDIFISYVRASTNKDIEGMQKLNKEKLPGWLKMIESRLVSNNGGNSYFVGETPTLADFEIFQLIWDFSLRDERKANHELTVIENAPKLKEFCERFLESSPNLKRYLETRASREY